jgi:hypothetical protein
VAYRCRLLTLAYRCALRAVAAGIPNPVTVPATAALLGLDEPTAEALLDHLVEFCLLDVDLRHDVTGFHYRLHPLVRLAVSELPPEVDTQTNPRVPAQPASGNDRRP